MGGRSWAEGIVMAITGVPSRPKGDSTDTWGAAEVIHSQRTYPRDSTDAILGLW